MGFKWRFECGGSSVWTNTFIIGKAICNLQAATTIGQRMPPAEVGMTVDIKRMTQSVSIDSQSSIEA